VIMDLRNTVKIVLKKKLKFQGRRTGWGLTRKSTKKVFILLIEENRVD